MKIVKSMFVADKIRVRDRVTGTVQVPAGARIVHCGPSPSDKGNVAVWAEAPSIAIPSTAMASVSLIILLAGDEVPDKATFRGMLLANPMLLIYELPSPGGGVS